MHGPVCRHVSDAPGIKDSIVGMVLISVSSLVVFLLVYRKKFYPCPETDSLYDRLPSFLCHEYYFVRQVLQNGGFGWHNE